MAKIPHSPFTILIDTRETHPWLFKDIPGLKSQGQIVVPTERHGLGTRLGDYTIDGAISLRSQWRISIERKSLNDLFSTILSNRDGFEEELENLNIMEYAAVVVEAPLEQVVSHIPQYWIEEEISPDKQLTKQRVVLGSIQAWQLRYPTVRWWFLSRSYAEIWVYRILHRFWEDRLKGKEWVI